MHQLGFFGTGAPEAEPASAERAAVLAPGVTARDYGLRWYQDEAKGGIEECLARVRSCLLVLATGLGKTRVAGSVIGDWEGPVLFLAHRDELITQGAEAIEALTGEQVEIEQAELRASRRARIVVGSMASVVKDHRLARLADGFKRQGGRLLIIIDEAHRAISKSYQDIVRTLQDAFPEAKLLGITATPDRGDGKAMGLMFEEVAYVLDIADGIDDGFLVPIRGATVELKEIDISGVKVSQGDLVAGQLDQVMVKAVEGAVSKVLELAGDRCGPLFWPGLKSAQFATERLNALKPGCAAFVHAGTPEEERKQTMRDVKTGHIQYLNNVGIATEGFDWPDANVVGLMRPTKSRSLHCQMVGRGTRTARGTVDHLREKGLGAERRALIAASSKPDTLVLDFVGNAGRHALVTPVDLLGGRYTDAEKALAKKKLREKPGGDVKAALEHARAELKAAAAAMTSKVNATVTAFDPFRALGVNKEKLWQAAQVFGFEPATEKQKAALLKAGIDDGALKDMPKHAATKLLNTLGKRRDLDLASMKQLKTLSRYCSPPMNISFKRASAAIDYISQGNWRVRDPQELDRILTQKWSGG